MSISHRPFSPRERKLLKAAASSDSFSWKTWFVATGWAMLVIAFLTGAVISRNFDLSDKAQWLAVLALAITWCAVSVPAFLRLRKKFGSTKPQQDLKKGTAVVHSFQIAEVIEMEEYEDLGPAYFLKTADERTLFLIGQYLDEYVQSGTFPAETIEITRAQYSNLVLAISCMGAPLRPSQKIGPFRKEIVRSNQVPKDGQLLSVEWSGIARRYA